MLVDKFGWAHAGLIQETIFPIIAICLISAVDPKTQWQAAKTPAKS
jgi:hypothetical protein